MTVLQRFRTFYGAGPLHLVAVVASLAIAGYAAARVVGNPAILLWFIAAVLLHDLALVPLYTLLDRIVAGRRPRRGVNYVRIPAAVSAVLLAISLPLVLSLAPRSYRSATGLRPEPYLERWIAVTAVLFAGSALLYTVRRTASLPRLNKRARRRFRRRAQDR